MLWTLLLLPCVATYTFTAALLAPLTGDRKMKRVDVEAAINVTVTEVLKDRSFSGLNDGNHTVEFLINDTECDRGAGIYKFVNLITQRERSEDNAIHAVIGPSCDEVCESIGLLAGRWRLPVISFGCISDGLFDKDEFPTLIKMVGSFSELRSFLRSIVTYFEWKRITLVIGGESSWLRAANDLSLDFRDYGIQSRIIELTQVAHLTETLYKEAEETRVFLLYAYGHDVHRFMVAAHNAGLINGKYIFLAINYGNMVMDMNLTVDLSQILGGMLDVTVDVHPERAEFETFSRRVEAFRGMQNNSLKYEDILQMAAVADAIYLYLVALNSCILRGGRCSGGGDIAQHLYSVERKGIAEHLSVNRDGSRNVSYMLHNIRDGHYVPVARSEHGGEGFQIIGDIDEIVWPGGSSQVPNPGPLCGWDDELCVKYDIPVLAGSIAAAVASLSIFIGIGYFIWRRKLAQVRLEREDWRINKDELTALAVQKSLHSIKTNLSYSTSVCSSNTRLSPELKQIKSLQSGAKNISPASLSEQTTLAMYDNQKVVLKAVARHDIPITKELVIEINAIRQLLHPNVNTLLGAYIEPGSNGLVWHYCTRGSLHDVLMDEDIKLDWVFNISFATDIARAMIYIHTSLVEVHGRLKTSNVLVGSHWDCKLGDMAMPCFRHGEDRPELVQSKYFKYLWTAPELLRNEALTRKGTRKGDVYSFAIIVQEILTRSLPYGSILHDRGDSRTIEQILERVKNVEIPLFRPHVQHTSKEEGLLADVMRLCWDEVPSNRPSFQNVLHLLTKLNKGRKTNILDQMIHRITKYSEHLENMIQERTLLLNEEKKKMDQLLSKMLPRAVIDDLKQGKSVEPESFLSVTVFFSDVVGFTQMAAQSTPYEVVNFLNSLYTMFDYVIDNFDVYKVETIGDAYMVVSGLPTRNDVRHAGEIGSMSLQLLSCVDKFKIAHMPDVPLKLRIGIHSGPVVAGVVGQTMPRYCLFGDTVNYASRMESSGEALRIHVSPECKQLLDELGGYHLEERGEISLKGIGKVVTYYLMGKEGFVDSISASEIRTSINVHSFKYKR